MLALAALALFAASSHGQGRKVAIHAITGQPRPAIRLRQFLRVHAAGGAGRSL